MVVEFGVPGGDDRIAHRQVGQGEQARTVIDAELICGRDVPQSPFPQRKIIGVPEQSEIGLLSGAVAVGPGPHPLDLVERCGIALASQRRRLRRAKL